MLKVWRRARKRKTIQPRDDARWDGCERPLKRFSLLKRYHSILVRQWVCANVNNDFCNQRAKKEGEGRQWLGLVLRSRRAP